MMEKRGKKRSAFQVPYAHKAVYALPCKIKKPPKWRFYILPGNWALPSGKIPDGIFLQAGLAVFALRERYPFYARKQKTSLRLSSPYAGKAVCLLPRKQKTCLKAGF